MSFYSSYAAEQSGDHDPVVGPNSPHHKAIHHHDPASVKPEGHQGPKGHVEIGADGKETWVVAEPEHHAKPRKGWR